MHRAGLVSPSVAAAGRRPIVPVHSSQVAHRIPVGRSVLLTASAIGFVSFVGDGLSSSPATVAPVEQRVRREPPDADAAISATAARDPAARARRRRPAAVDGPKPDFDGDGYADLAVGAPFARVGARHAGGVHVIYGSPTGLSPARRELWTQDSAGVPDRAELGDLFGWTLANGDFDGDGFTDLAIMARWERFRRIPHAGAVFILRGSPTGLTSDGAGLLHQGSPGIAGRPKRNNDFGWAAVAADFDADGFDDLAVTALGEDTGARDAGRVHILYGSGDGLRGRASQAWSQQSQGIADHAEANDHFGASLAAGDFDGDSDADLAIGVAYEGRRAIRQGIVHVLRGTPQGLVARRGQVWSQDTPGIADGGSLRDQFGQSLGSGDLNRDGFDDLVVGVWYEDFRNHLTNEGAFHVILGSGRGLRARGSQFWHQDRPDVLGRGALSERFSWSLTALDLDGDGRDDVVAGTPHSDLGGDPHSNKGAVHIFFGAPGGLTARGDRYLTQDTPGVAGHAERFDHFGETLGGADFDADGFEDLVVGLPWENIRRPNDGAAWVLPGARRGFALDRDRTWTAYWPRVAADGRVGPRFGWSTSNTSPSDGSATTGDPLD